MKRQELAARLPVGVDRERRHRTRGMVPLHSVSEVGTMKFLMWLIVCIAIAGVQPAFAETDSEDKSDPLQSLITATPAEGFELALMLSRRGVTSTQKDKTILRSQRPEYAADAAKLIAASQVVAIHFQTIAAANNYWRD